MTTHYRDIAEMTISGEHLEALLVPYEQATRVSDTLDDGRVDVYDEGFIRGAFAEQLKQPRNTLAVMLFPRHTRSGVPPEEWGRARQLREIDEGLHGVFRVHPSRRSDVVDLVESGVNGMSIEFHTLQRRHRTRGNDGVRWRDRAWLDAVALTPQPSYADAQVLALREADEAAEADRRAARQRTFDELDAYLDEMRARS